MTTMTPITSKQTKPRLSRKQKWKRRVTNLSIMTVTLLILLVIVEFLVRWLAPQELSGTWTSLSEKGYIINKYSWESQHVHLDRRVRYRFNSQHLRGEEPDSTAYKILCLGDSFTFGWLLEEDKTYVGLLNQFAARDMKQKVQFMNGGTGGWGAADYRDFLEEFGDGIRPDMVLVFFNGGDLQRSLHRNQFNMNESGNVGFKKRLDRSSLYQWLLEHSHLTQWLRVRLISASLPAAGPLITPDDSVKTNGAVQDLTPQEVAECKAGAALGREIFLDMAAWCRQRNISFAVGTTGWFGYDSTARPFPESLFLNDLDSLMREAHGTNLNIADLTGGPLMREPEKYIIAGDQHPDEAGAMLIATSTWTRLHPLLDSLLRAKAH